MTEKVTVTGVLDGETFVGEAEGERGVYGLYDVRTPERGDPDYRKVESALAELIVGKTVSVEQKDSGWNGFPYVVVTTPEGEDVNAAIKRVAKMYN